MSSVNIMAHDPPEAVQIKDTDARDVREMKMMRFIFALPVADITLLPKEDRFCALCCQPYNRSWDISDNETAVVLPCGDFVGSICIRRWLSPFEDGRTKCPFPECGLQFPCSVDGMHRHDQTIIRGKLRPTKRVKYSPSATFKDGGTLVGCGRGGDEDDECQDSEEDSVATEELVGEIADDPNAANLEDEASCNEFAKDLPPPHSVQDHARAASAEAEVSGRSSPTCGKEHEDVSIIDSEDRWHAETAETEASEVKGLGSWAMVREALRRIALPHVQRRGKSGHILE